MKVEFLYENGCPNVEDARVALRAALRASGLAEQWQEWERNDPAAPPHARQYGSPTILVNGQDVVGEPPNPDASCRIYASEPGRNRGVPPTALIIAALGVAQRRREVRFRWLGFLPAASTALLPKLTCPACWPAYAALLSSLGVGFVDYTPWLFPATAVFLAVTLALLAWRPRRGHAPLALGIVSSAVVLLAKFYFDSDDGVYAGIALLAVASFWNAWPKKSAPACNC